MSEQGPSPEEHPGPDVSIVVPLYNEEDAVPELVERCRAAVEATGWPYELILVDDRSQDGTRQALEALAEDDIVLPVHLEQNIGQIGATCAGLSRCRGSRVVVLDGDLQDPPETITTLVAEHDISGGWEDVIFAVKSSRDDPLWFRCARVVFGLMGRIGSGRLPMGAGSFLLMRRELALRVANAPMTHQNLASVLSVMAERVGTVDYHKAARAHGASRVGPLDLFREGVGAWMITAALERVLLLVALLVPGAVLLVADNGLLPCKMLCVAFTWMVWGLSLGGSLWAGFRRRSLLAKLRPAPVSPPTA